ncbi:hypothetical protein ABKV19_017641 [Rosa sericea]
MESPQSPNPSPASLRESIKPPRRTSLRLQISSIRPWIRCPKKGEIYMRLIRERRRGGGREEERNLDQRLQIKSSRFQRHIHRENPYPIGDIQFQIALSEGVSTVCPKHKAVCVRASTSDSTGSMLEEKDTARFLMVNECLMILTMSLENHTNSSDLYIGVKERRSISTGPKTRRLVTSLDFHRVIGGDESYLYVNDVGIKTGDYFHFYHPDPQTTLSSCTNRSVSLKTLKIDENSKDCWNVGC